MTTSKLGFVALKSLKQQGPQDAAAILGELRTIYFKTTKQTIDADFAPTVALLERLRAGEAADVAILTEKGVDDLIAEGRLRPNSRTDVALSFVGVAVKQGAPKPDISTVDAFKASLVAARSVAYSKIGASGLYFAGLIERLGIAAQVVGRTEASSRPDRANHVTVIKDGRTLAYA